MRQERRQAENKLPQKRYPIFLVINIAQQQQQQQQQKQHQKKKKKKSS